jgi:glycosyltransferase involved in cell wall biosynthesis
MLSSAIPFICAAIRGDDQIMVVLDSSEAPTEELRRILDKAGATVILNAANRGLAYSRNQVLKESQNAHVAFIDDDVRITSQAVEHVRHSLSEGFDMVGVRINAHFVGRRVPWYLTTGQYHYLGSHNPAYPATVWGAFFAIDIEKARLFSVTFNERLGRAGGSLLSAEDTTFVREMISCGATSTVLHDVEVLHIVPEDRLRLQYLVRRAYWQGRSERRRSDGWNGLRKELRRNWQADCQAVRRVALTILYGTFVVMGIAWEAIVSRFASSDVLWGVLK